MTELYKTHMCLYYNMKCFKGDVSVKYEEECRLDVFKELHEENEQLKTKLEYEKKQHRHWKTECLESIKEVSQLKRGSVGLTEENEQLKQRVKQLEDNIVNKIKIISGDME